MDRDVATRVPIIEVNHFTSILIVYSECGSYKSAARCVRIMWNIEDMMYLIQRGQCSRLGTHFGIAIVSPQKILFLLFERLR